VLDEIVRMTDGASAAFVRELMRRAWLFHPEGKRDGQMRPQEVENAWTEIVQRSSGLGTKLLGGTIGFARGQKSGK